MVAWGPIIGAAIPAIASMFGGNETSGRQDETRTRLAPTPEARKIRDLLENFRFNTENPLQDRFGRKADYERGIGNDYIGNLQNLFSGLSGAYGDAAGLRRDSMLGGKIGGNQVDFVPKGARERADWATKAAEAIFNAGGDVSTKEYSVRSQDNPDKAFFDMLKYLEGINEGNLNREAGLAGTATTGNIQGPSNIIPGLLESLKGTDFTKLFQNQQPTTVNNNYGLTNYDPNDAFKGVDFSNWG